MCPCMIVPLSYMNRVKEENDLVHVLLGQTASLCISVVQNKHWLVNTMLILILHEGKREIIFPLFLFIGKYFIEQMEL